MSDKSKLPKTLLGIPLVESNDLPLPKIQVTTIEEQQRQRVICEAIQSVDSITTEDPDELTDAQRLSLAMLAGLETKVVVHAKGNSISTVRPFVIERRDDEWIVFSKAPPA